jgi:uncharacterized membrane protein
MIERNRDLLVVGALALAALGLGLSGVNQPALRLLLGLPLALFLPGYALAAALVPGSPGWAERLAQSLGLSLALTVLGGFVLNALPGGLQPTSWLVLLAGVTLAGALAAIVRRRGASSVAHTPVRVGPMAAIALAVALLGAVGAVGVARSGADGQAASGFTQLWMQPDETGAVVIGVRSMEPAPVAYTVRLESGGALLQEWPAVQLAPGETWETAASWAVPSGATLEAALYRADQPDAAYRQVTLQR